MRTQFLVIPAGQKYVDMVERRLYSLDTISCTDEYLGIEIAHRSENRTMSAVSGDNNATAVGGMIVKGQGGDRHGEYITSSLMWQLDQTRRSSSAI